MSSTSSFMQTAVDAVKSKDIFKVSSCLTLFAALYPGQYNINEQDGKGHTLLYYALTEGTKEEGIVPESIALFLLQQGADGTLGETMAHSKITAVHLAVERKFLQVREKLIDKMPTISSVDDFTVGIYPYFMKVGLVKIFEHIEKIKSNKQAVLAFLRMKKVFIASIYIDGIRLGDFLRREFFAFISAQDLTTISIETAPSNAGDAEQNYFRMKCLLRGKMREVAVRNMPEQFLDFFHAIQNGNLQKVKDRKFNSGYLSVVGIITGARWQSFF